MARRFVRTSQQYIDAAVLPLTTQPATLAAWVRPASSQAASIVMSLSGSTSDHWIYLSLNSLQALIQAYDGVASQTASAGSSTIGTWGHLVGTTSNANGQAFWNGVGGTLSSTVVTSSGMNHTTIGDVWSGSALNPNFFDGDIAEVGIWNVVLSAIEITILAAGVSPLLVRPNALVGYWPLIVGHATLEPDLIGHRDLTLGNNPLLVTHPRIYLPDLVTPEPTKFRATVGNMFLLF